MKLGKSSSAASCVSFVLLFAGWFYLSPPEVTAKPIELSFAMHLPPKAAPYAAAYRPWAKEIEKRTNGQLKFKFYLAQTLLKARDAYQGVINGVADLLLAPAILELITRTEYGRRATGKWSSASVGAAGANLESRATVEA